MVGVLEITSYVFKNGMSLSADSVEACTLSYQQTIPLGRGNIPGVSRTERWRMNMADGWAWKGNTRMMSLQDAYGLVLELEEHIKENILCKACHGLAVIPDKPGYVRECKKCERGIRK
jgi:hypothetical protein